MIFGRRRSRRWPTVDLYETGGRGDIKMLSVQDLERLMVKADESPWSAVGRPEWFRQQRENIHRVTLVVFGIEDASVYRCIVTAILKDQSGSFFTLDVAFDDFDSLPDVTPKFLVTLAHLYLESFPPLKLDPSQEESWKRLEDSPGLE